MFIDNHIILVTVVRCLIFFITLLLVCLHVYIVHQLSIFSYVTTRIFSPVVPPVYLGISHWSPFSVPVPK